MNFASKEINAWYNYIKEVPSMQRFDQKPSLNSIVT
jgi:hypothetical protein